MTKRIQKWTPYVILCIALCFFIDIRTPAAEMGTEAKAAYLSDDFLQNNSSWFTDSDDGVELRILFVGNSLTSRNHMGKTLEQMAAAGGHNIQVETLWAHCCSLSQYARKGNPMRKKLRRLLEMENWDYVVLQDRTTRPVTVPARSRRAVKKLQHLIESNGAEMMFLETWAPRSGHRLYRKLRRQGIRLDPVSFQQNVRSFYSSLGLQYGAEVIRAGDAMERAGKASGLQVLSQDGKHPSAQGSYLIACVCYETFFGEPAPAWNGSINNSSAWRLRKIATRTVHGG